MEAPASICSCTGEAKTSTPGVSLTGTFPTLAQRVDGLSIARSLASGNGGHNQLPVLTRNNSEATMGSVRHTR